MKHILRSFLCALLVTALTLGCTPALAKKEGKGAGNGKVKVVDSAKPVKSNKDAKPGKGNSDAKPGQEKKEKQDKKDKKDK